MTNAHHDFPHSSAVTTFVTLSTAHPAKFDAAVQQALPTSQFSEFNFDKQVMPDELRQLEGMEKRVTRVKGEQGVRDLIESIAGEEAHDKEGLGSV
jgi:threonine synthase